METESEPNKIETIYELRDAVETKVHAERALEATGSQAARDALLTAQLDLEAKTQDAIDVCRECGHAHPPAHDHTPGMRGVSARHDNVIAVDFRPSAKPA